MSSVFSKIIDGKIPCYKVAENENCFAFLDINPLHFGHTLVVPKLEVDYIFDLPDNHYLELMLFAKVVSKAIASVIPCLRIGVAVIGLEVPHAHIHLVPLQNMHGLDFGKPKLQFTESEFSELADTLNATIKNY